MVHALRTTYYALPSRHFDLLYFRHDFVTEDVESIRIAYVAEADDALVEAEVGQIAEAIHHLLHRHAALGPIARDVNVVQTGFLDLFIGPVLSLAVSAQYVEFMTQSVVASASEEVATVGIL